MHRTPCNARRLVTAPVLLCLAVVGCAHVPAAKSTLPVDGAPVARELEKVSLPRYVIEPPDILLIDALRVVPKAPFRIEPFDALYIDVVGTSIETGPIRGVYLVEPGGGIDLGAAYGKVNVAGLSLEEATDAVDRQLRKVLTAPQVSLTLYQSAGQQQIIGEHLVAPDGTINLGTYGKVYVTGFTIPEATDAIRRHLSQYLEETEISVDILSYNSKVYYIIREGAGNGDEIQRFPITGNETVLDAVALVNGLTQLSSKNIWISRPSPDGSCFQILPVDWEEVTRGGLTATNYQVLPGDRIFIEEDHVWATTAMLGRITAPFQRVFEFALFGANTTQVFQRFPEGTQ